MKNFIFATIALVFTAAAVHAVSPTTGNYNRDSYGVSAPILPLEEFTIGVMAPSSTLVSASCPAGTGQVEIATSPSTVEFSFKPNGTSCPVPTVATPTTAGTSCNKGQQGKQRYWIGNTTEFILFKAPSGTEIYLSCWSYL